MNDMTLRIDRLVVRYAMLLLLLLVTGCRQSLGSPDRDPGSSSPRALPRVSLSLVLSESLPGLRSKKEVAPNPYESKVTGLQFLLFDANDGDKFAEIPEVIWTAPESSSYHTSFHIHSGEGTYKLLVVANYAFSDQSSLKGKTLKEIQSYLITSEPSADGPFVMAGLSKVFVARNNPDADLGQIDLIRLASRVDVHLKSSELSNPKLISVEVRNRITQSLLMSVGTETLSARETKVYTPLTSYDYSSKSHIPSDSKSEGQIYLYENPSSATEGAHKELGTVVIVRLSEDGEELDPIEVPLPEVQRNRFFKITVGRGYVSVREGRSMFLYVRPWDANEPIELKEEELLRKLGAL